MIRIKQAKHFFEKLDYSNYDNPGTYATPVLICENCSEMFEFTFQDLDKHRCSKDSNLDSKDKKLMDRLILSIIPKKKLKLKKQLWALTKHDRRIVLIQRIFLRLICTRGKFPPILSTKENIPDSFIDYYCRKCHAPIRIYYFSFLGGRHSEFGFVLKYVLN